MPYTLDAGSIVFHAACNEAVEAAMRPIRQRVLNRLALRCRADSQVSKLFADTWDQAENDIPEESESPWRQTILENKFVNLIASDSRWKTVVLNAVVEERRWSDLWSRGYEVFSDRLLSFLEKLNSPDHPAARLTTGALTSMVAFLLAAWVPTKIAKDPNLYDKVLRPLLKPFQSSVSVPLDLKTKADGIELHAKVVVDDRDFNVSFKPIVRPNNVRVTVHPVMDAALAITPQIQYSGALEKPGGPSADPQGLGVRLIPAMDLSLLPKELWDPKSGLKVSVTELDAPTDKPVTPQSSSSKESGETERATRPLDKIGAGLEALSSDFQASKSDSQSSLAALQQSQNSIRSIAANHGRTTIIEASPNSVHSVVLQWVGEDSKPQSCALTLEVGDISAEGLSLSVAKQQCSSNISLVARLPHTISLGPGEPQQLGPWILSVDHTRRHWIFQHAATLRFTWQPADKSKTAVTQTAEKLP